MMPVDNWEDIVCLSSFDDQFDWLKILDKIYRSEFHPNKETCIPM